MATYVCSDVHGCFSKFESMLKGIEFSESDTLYILGDIIDRGTQNLDLVECVRSKENIILLKGNHEQMMVDYYKNKVEYDSWFDSDWLVNGGLKTYNELKVKSKSYIDDLVEYFDNLPTVVIIDNFVLLHGGLVIDSEVGVLEEVLASNTVSTVLWDRDFIVSKKKIDGYTVICGHTPTLSLGDNEVMYRDGAMLIDCGCVYDGGNLACVRLDDMEEFYF